MSSIVLVPCGGCHRHVRADEVACPFCARLLGEVSLAGIVPEPTQRLSRAGMVAFAAAFLSSGCFPVEPPAAPPYHTAVDGGSAVLVDAGAQGELPVESPGPSSGEMNVPCYGEPPPPPPSSAMPGYGGPIGVTRAPCYGGPIAPTVVDEPTRPIPGR